MKLNKPITLFILSCIVVALSVATGIVIVRSINTPQAPWRLDSSWKSPVDMRYGAVFAELNGDGLPDILQSYGRFDPPVVRGSYINTGSGWKEDNRWLPPEDIIIGSVSLVDHHGIVVVDINGDGLSDIVRSDNDIRRIYLNTGAGWNDATKQWIQGWDSQVKILDRNVDEGLRFQDLNGDGLVDMIKTRTQNSGIDTWVYFNRGVVSE